MSVRDEISGEACVALGADQQRFDAYPTREVSLGALAVRRALPIRERRLVGPWCFLDRFGPLSFSAGKPMDVAPHPHIGLQTRLVFEKKVTACNLPFSLKCQPGFCSDR